MEAHHWIFGGGLERSRISGCVSKVPPTLLLDEFKHIFLEFVAQNGWSFEGDIAMIVDGHYINPDGTRGAYAG